jgi:uncharacterized C2H2 Zn-finger protein
MDQCPLCKQPFNLKSQSSDCPHSPFPRMQPEQAMKIAELEGMGDWRGLRDYASLTNNKVAAETANAKADRLYEQENPYSYLCPACSFSTRERPMFISHLGDAHKYERDRAEREAQRQETEQTGKQVTD